MASRCKVLGLQASGLDAGEEHKPSLEFGVGQFEKVADLGAPKALVLDLPEASDAYHRGRGDRVPEVLDRPTSDAAVQEEFKTEWGQAISHTVHDLREHRTEWPVRDQHHHDIAAATAQDAC